MEKVGFTLRIENCFDCPYMLIEDDRDMCDNIEAPNDLEAAIVGIPEECPELKKERARNNL